jgi:hypothetical protein
MDDDALKEKLAMWKVEPEVPPDFQRGVWRRIMAREPSSSKWRPFGILAFSVVGHPRFASYAVVLAIIAGTALGFVEGSKVNSKSWKTLESKYVESVDPYWHRGTF